MKKWRTTRFLQCLFIESSSIRTLSDCYARMNVYIVMLKEGGQDAKEGNNRLFITGLLRHWSSFMF